MRDINLSNNDDLNIAPSESLKRETLAVMESFENTKEIQYTAKRRKPGKVLLMCAAIVCLMAMLISAGIHVFDYLAYVPGLGIITAHQDQIYTLKERTRLGTFYVEAISALPVTEGEYKGMWKIHIVTDKYITGSMLQDPKHAGAIYLTGKDGEQYPIDRSGGGSNLSRYEGYAKIDGSGEYTLMWNNYDCTVTLNMLENSVWANYSYPVDEGITLIAFPLSENSQYIVYDVLLDPESENLIYWAKYCDMITCIPEIRLTDTNGNYYYSCFTSGRAIGIPDSEKDHGINAFLDYKIDYIGKLDVMPTAPIVKIESSSIELMLHDMENTPEYATITIPELNEVVRGEELPNDGLIIDDHGIKIKIEEITTIIDEKNNDYRMVISTSIPEVNFEENVSRLDIHLSCIDKNSQDGKRKTHSSGAGGLGYVKDWFPELGEQITNSYCSIYGDGDLDTKGVMNATYGDEVGITFWGVTITIDGEWIIDFTAKE